MGKFLLSWLLFAVCTLPAYADGQRLLGSWKSDKKVTLEYLKRHTKLRPEAIAKLDTILGKMVLTFDGQTLTENSGDWKATSKYTIINETPNLITIQSIDPTTKKSQQTRIEFDKNGLWATDDKIPGYKERFEKVAGQ